ncbi:aminoglycoside 6-adenylyltransferase [Cryobacterium sp. LW097]|uniref:aminoglycoside 6-adenylyltransferase n=1 Tax=Cryobacterium sp. LW097 TaxID=1978566 RepID=UPI000EF570C8|nr:aminoglycoside 6-adenylyltransferase [Cryobacterium sp. LW097]
MDSTLADVPARLRPTLRMLLTRTADDERIRSVWLEGSLARGLADDWSDLDLHLAVADPASFAATDWLESQVHLVLSDAIPGVTGVFICVTSDWIHIDLNVHSSQSEFPPGETRCVLLDRDNQVQRAELAPSSPSQPFFPAQDVQIFLYFLGQSVASVRRGDLIAQSQATSMLRDRVLINLLLAENGIRSDMVSKRIGGHLSVEQMRCLTSIPAFGLSELSLRNAQRCIASAYLGRARKLSETCEAPWPTELEQATKELLNRELQMIW